jgi:hypothetical protein
MLEEPLGEVEDPPPLAQHVGGHPLLDINLSRSRLCPDPIHQGPVLGPKRSEGGSIATGPGCAVRLCNREVRRTPYSGSS